MFTLLGATFCTNDQSVRRRDGAPNNGPHLCRIFPIAYWFGVDLGFAVGPTGFASTPPFCCTQFVLITPCGFSASCWLMFGCAFRYSPSSGWLARYSLLLANEGSLESSAAMLE